MDDVTPISDVLLDTDKRYLIHPLHHPKDHANARILAEGLAELPAVVCQTSARKYSIERKLIRLEIASTTNHRRISRLASISCLRLASSVVRACS